MSPQHRWLLKWARTVHLYAALFALTLVLFFALTGFMLNHEDWFSPRDPFTRTWTGSVPTGLLQEPDKLGVVEILRKDMGARELSIRSKWKKIAYAYSSSDLEPISKLLFSGIRVMSS